MNQHKNPQWWTTEHDSAWDRTKAAFKRDWEQTKHDVGAKAPDLRQNAKDTVKQAAGKESIPPGRQPNYEQVEPAYRFGHGAHAHYGNKYSSWNSEVENRLKTDWQTTYPDRTAYWDEDREAIHHAWDFKG